MQQKILQMKEDLGIGSRMFELATGDLHGIMMGMLDN